MKLMGEGGDVGSFIQIDELGIFEGMAGRIDSLMGAAVTIASTMGE